MSKRDTLEAVVQNLADEVVKEALAWRRALPASARVVDTALLHAVIAYEVELKRLMEIGRRRKDKARR